MSEMNNVINTFYICAYVDLVVWTEIFMNMFIMETITLLRDNIRKSAPNTRCFLLWVLQGSHICITKTIQKGLNKKFNLLE
jgi:hypothetical protein